MANIVIQENGSARTRPAVHGEELTFNAPCNDSRVTGVKIAGNVYPFYDTRGESIAYLSGLFVEGSLIKVMIDTVNTRAVLLTLPVTRFKATVDVPITDWEQDNTELYYIIIPVQGVGAYGTYLADVDTQFASAKEAAALIELWSLITRITTATNQICLYATEVPSTPFSFMLEEV